MVGEAVWNVFVNELTYYSSLFTFAARQKRLQLTSGKSKLVCRMVNYLQAAIHNPRRHPIIRAILSKVIEQLQPRGVASGVQELYQAVFTGVLPDLYTLHSSDNANPYL